MDWGSVSSWVAAVGTTVSLLLAISVARRQILDAHSSQAAQFHGWITTFSDGHRQGVRCAVLNGSTTPVYDVSLHVLDPSYSQVRAVEFGMVLPGDQIEEAKDIPLTPGEWHSWVEFTDGSGNAWRRDTTGRLAEDRHGWTAWLGPRRRGAPELRRGQLTRDHRSGP